MWRSAVNRMVRKLLCMQIIACAGIAMQKRKVESSIVKFYSVIRIGSSFNCSHSKSKQCNGVRSARIQRKDLYTLDVAGMMLS